MWKRVLKPEPTKPIPRGDKRREMGDGRREERSREWSGEVCEDGRGTAHSAAPVAFARGLVGLAPVAVA
jgi:hypothetical protein